MGGMAPISYAIGLNHNVTSYTGREDNFPVIETVGFFMSTVNHLNCLNIVCVLSVFAR